MSPYNEDNTLDSSGYQGYHRSHHRSHTQDNQSEKIEVTIQGHTEESNSSQIEKKTKISLPWKHRGQDLKEMKKEDSEENLKESEEEE